MHLGKAIPAILAILFISLAGSAQIKAVEKFLKENDNLSKFFIYQSTLRMLNESGDPDFNKLIKGIRKINVYIAEDGSAGVTATRYQRMINDLSAEKFETLVSAKQEGTLFNLMTRESGDDAYYVLAASEGEDFALLEMDGKLDLRYLQALENVNFTKLRKIVGQDNGGKDTEEILN